MQHLKHWLNQSKNLLIPYVTTKALYKVTSDSIISLNCKKEQKPTSFSVVLATFQATEFSVTCSANRDNSELPGLVSALRGRNGAWEVWLDVGTPDDDEGREFDPHTLLVNSEALSLPEVEGRVPLPPDDGRALSWLGELVPPLALGDTEEPHAFNAEDGDLFPQLREPLTNVRQHKNQLPSLDEQRQQKTTY